MYIGNEPALAYTSFAVQHFTTSATTSYTLDHSVANENEIALFINNVRQEPGSSYAYTASGTALTLSAATSASDTMYCVFLGKAVQTVTPAVGSVTNDMLAGSIANSKLANSSITLNGSAVSLGGSASVNGIFETQLLHVRDEKSNATSGGTSASGSFNIRDLNTVLTNEISGASLSSNKITLPSGTYYVEASAPAYETNQHRIFLYNESDGSNILFGGSATSDGGQGSHAFLSGRFTLSASKNIELRHYTSSSKAGDGLGRDVNQGTNEIFAEVKIWKLS